VTPYRSALPTGDDGFPALLRAELTKLRTVPGWVMAGAVAAALIVGFALLASGGGHSRGGPPPRDADGTPVVDRFTFVHRPLPADGAVTVRVASLTAPDGPEPWAKAGLVVKAGTSPGAAYAAVMVTGAHGVRMQHDFVDDVAGPASARWLRLARAGDVVTASASTDGATWSTVGTTRLAGPAEIGLFVTTPPHETFDQFLGGTSASGHPVLATAVFDGLAATGVPASGWETLAVGAGDDPRALVGAAAWSGDTVTVTGAGDIAPAVEDGPGLEQTLVGGFVALTVMVILGVLFVTTEYRRGMLRTSLVASPRRGRVLAAKSVVIAAVTFAGGLVATAVALLAGKGIMGDAVHPVSALTQLRMVVGTAALLAIAAVFGVAVGTILRRGAGAVAAVVVLTTLPYILSVSAVLPVVSAQWVLRVTPAAAFAVQQTVREYPQVNAAYTPAFGFFPLPPWGGFAVLCAWTAAALAVAAVLLRRRDA